MKLKQLLWALSPFAAGALLWLTLGAAADLEYANFPSVRVAHTNYVNELVITNGATLNGVRKTAWPSGGSGSTNWIDSGTTNATIAGTASMYNLVVSNAFTTPSLIAGTLSLSNIVASTVPVFDGSTPPVLVSSDCSTNTLHQLGTNTFFGTGRIPLESQLTNVTSVLWDTNTLILSFGAGLTWNTNTLILTF